MKHRRPTCRCKRCGAVHQRNPKWHPGHATPDMPGFASNGSMQFMIGAAYTNGWDTLFVPRGVLPFDPEVPAAP
jgi:hypothetical protein